MNLEAGAIIGIDYAVWILLGDPFVEAVLDHQVVVVGVGEGDHLVGPVCHLVGLVFAQKSEKRKCWEMINTTTCALCDSFFEKWFKCDFISENVMKYSFILASFPHELPGFQTFS